MEKKIAVGACTGFANVLGTISRRAEYYVVDEMRKEKTVLLCPPALAAGVEEDVRFIKDHPVLTIEGCAAQCQRKIVELAGGHVEGVIIVEDIAKKNSIVPEQGVRSLGASGAKLARIVGDEAAKMVDRLYSGEKLELPPCGSPKCNATVRGSMCIVPCTGMGKALGGATRLGGHLAEERCEATFVCLPSLSARSGGYEDAIKNLPSIAIDGCVEKCASKLVQSHGGKLKGRIFLPKLMKEKGLKAPENRIDLGEAGELLGKGIADEIMKNVAKVKKAE